MPSSPGNITSRTTTSGRMGLEHLQRRRPVRGVDDLNTFSLEIAPDDFTDGGFIVDDQDDRCACHGPTLAHEPRPGGRGSCRALGTIHPNALGTRCRPSGDRPVGRCRPLGRSGLPLGGIGHLDDSAVGERVPPAGAVSSLDRIHRRSPVQVGATPLPPLPPRPAPLLSANAAPTGSRTASDTPPARRAL